MTLPTKKRTDDPINNVRVQCYSQISDVFEVFDQEHGEYRYITGDPQWMIVLATESGKMYTKNTGLTLPNEKEKAEKMASEITNENFNKNEWRFWRNIYGSPAWESSQPIYFGGE